MHITDTFTASGALVRVSAPNRSNHSNRSNRSNTPIAFDVTNFVCGASMVVPHSLCHACHSQASDSPLILTRIPLPPPHIPPCLSVVAFSYIRGSSSASSVFSSGRGASKVNIMARPRPPTPPHFPVCSLEKKGVIMISGCRPRAHHRRLWISETRRGCRD